MSGRSITAFHIDLKINHERDLPVQTITVKRVHDTNTGEGGCTGETCKNCKTSKGFGFVCFTATPQGSLSDRLGKSLTSESTLDGGTCETRKERKKRFAGRIVKFHY